MLMRRKNLLIGLIDPTRFIVFERACVRTHEPRSTWSASASWMATSNRVNFDDRSDAEYLLRDLPADAIDSCTKC